MTVLIIATAASFISSVFATFFADRLLDERIAIVGRFIGLQRTHNPGIAFSITFPPLLQTFLIAAALVLVTIVAVRSIRGSHKPRAADYPAMSYGFILGGALGNIVDRFGDGLVTDYFQVGTFPIFNVADSCITIGVALLLLDAVVDRFRARS